MHSRSLERFDFDSVMLPYNFVQMQDAKYAHSFNELYNRCQTRDIAIQTIKSIARKPWEGDLRTHNTYFYEPLVSQEAIDKSIHWALDLQNSFMITAGDISLLPQILDAAKRFSKRPTDSEMNILVQQFGIKRIFPY